MFTGIIQGVGRLARREHCGGDQRLFITAGGAALEDAALGESIAVNGVCLTVASREAQGFWADVSAESLAHTTLGALTHNAALNLEKSLTLSRPLNGHLVSGHVDAVGTVAECRDDGRSVRFSIDAPVHLVRYIAHKGSIAVDGVSLTVNAIDGARFEVNIVPHTLTATNLSAVGRGTAVNLEVDLMARYLERLLAVDGGADEQTGKQGSNLKRALNERGFLSAVTSTKDGNT